MTKGVSNKDTHNTICIIDKMKAMFPSANSLCPLIHFAPALSLTSSFNELLQSLVALIHGYTLQENFPVHTRDFEKLFDLCGNFQAKNRERLVYKTLQIAIKKTFDAGRTQTYHESYISFSSSRLIALISSIIAAASNLFLFAFVKGLGCLGVTCCRCCCCCCCCCCCG